MGKRFHQVEGSDFAVTFNLVVKRTIIWLVLCLANSFGWDVQQLDMPNAFLYGHLQEDFYICQPPGFLYQPNPNIICKLCRTFYGLKQALLAWFSYLSSFLVKNGFVASKLDHSLFVCCHNNFLLYFLDYVNDILITGNNSDLINDFICNLGPNLQFLSLGLFIFFLELKLHNNYWPSFISTQIYIQDLLQQIGMEDCKPIASPLSISIELSRDLGITFEDITLLRNVVGAFQYPTIAKVKPQLFNK